MLVWLPVSSISWLAYERYKEYVLRLSSCSRSERRCTTFWLGNPSADANASLLRYLYWKHRRFDRAGLLPQFGHWSHVLHIVAGFASGFTAAAVTQPLDVVCRCPHAHEWIFAGFKKQNSNIDGT